MRFPVSLTSLVLVLTLSAPSFRTTAVKDPFLIIQVRAEDYSSVPFRVHGHFLYHRREDSSFIKTDTTPLVTPAELRGDIARCEGAVTFDALEDKVITVTVRRPGNVFLAIPDMPPVIKRGARVDVTADEVRSRLAGPCRD